MLKRFCDPGAHTTLSSGGLLLLRVGFGGMMAVGHGWVKVQNFAAHSNEFVDFAGLGPKLSLSLAILGELGCGALLVIGLGTRLAAVPFAITMIVAMMTAHAADPIFMTGTGGAKEPALLYLIPALTLFFTGPGMFSLDAMLAGGGGAKKKSE